MTWVTVYSEFKRISDWYRKTRDVSPVIVIDNINRLSTKAPEILKILQDGAKDAVGTGLFRAVFVTSDGSAPSQMQCKFNHNVLARSSISRGKLYRMRDMSKLEVSKFLDANQIHRAVHDRAFSLTSGRIHQLKLMVPDLKNKNLSFEGRNLLIVDAQEALFEEIGLILFNHWEKIDTLHRPTCKKIFEFALTHENFTKIDRAKIVFHGHAPECIGNALNFFFRQI